MTSPRESNPPLKTTRESKFIFSPVLEEKVGPLISNLLSGVVVQSIKLQVLLISTPFTLFVKKYPKLFS